MLVTGMVAAAVVPCIVFGVLLGTLGAAMKVAAAGKTGMAGDGVAAAFIRAS